MLRDTTHIFAHTKEQTLLPSVTEGARFGLLGRKTPVQPNRSEGNFARLRRQGPFSRGPSLLGPRKRLLSFVAAFGLLLRSITHGAGLGKCAPSLAHAPQLIRLWETMLERMLFANVSLDSAIANNTEYSSLKAFENAMRSGDADAGGEAAFRDEAIRSAIDRSVRKCWPNCFFGRTLTFTGSPCWRRSRRSARRSLRS